MPDSTPVTLDGRLQSLRHWTHVIYALHAFSVLTGILGTATIIGAFPTGWPSIVAGSSIASYAAGSRSATVGRCIGEPGARPAGRPDERLDPGRRPTDDMGSSPFD